MYINVNLFNTCSTGVGVNAIQGLLTISGEDSKNCTRIIPRIYNTAKIKKQIDIIVSRGIKVSNRFITGMKPDVHQTRAEIKKFGTNQEDVVCKDLHVRVIYPLIPHGSNSPATQERITILPQLYSIQDNYETLEIAKAGSWNKISAIYRDLRAGPVTPLGLSVNYGKIPYTFPAAIPYHLNNLVGGALIGRAKQTSGPMAIEAYEIINNYKYARKACQKQEKEVVDTFISKFYTMIAMERYSFGRNSFFSNMYDISGDGIRLEPTIEDSNNEDLNEITGVVEVLGIDTSRTTKRSVYDTV